jgi:zinc D-Ala-D-Ala dipeptidase
LKPYQRISITESGESLVPISEEFAFVTPHPYLACGADYGVQSPYYLRASVLEKLQSAQAYLQAQHPHWRLQIFDAYRPVEVQQYMVDYTFRQAAQEQGLDSTQLSEPAAAELWQQVYKIWAVPSFDLATPPPHSTGAAIDLTIVDQQEQPLDMGSPIDEMSDRSQPDYFADRPEGQTYHQNRQLLCQVMEQAGFQRHPGEWWHFSWGDQLWAWICQENNRQELVTAHYGRFIQ